jgi:hypothetical protein
MILHACSAPGRWDEGDDVIAAENFVELDGEQEVDDSLDDTQIVSFVTTQGTEEPDSDEEDDPLPVPISHSDAMSCVETLKEYVAQHAETFQVSISWMMSRGRLLVCA